MTDDSLDRLVAMLGGWPKYFRAAEKRHGLSLLGQLRRDRVVDEGVFGMVIRYAVYRAEFDMYQAAIVRQRDSQHLSADAEGEVWQLISRRDAAKNQCAALEGQLLATPFVRAKSGTNVQTTFMDLLTKAPREVGGDNKVTPFTPLGRTSHNA